MVKQFVYQVIACLGILGCVVIHSIPEALSSEITTYSMHSPIYPTESDTVTYTLYIDDPSFVQSIELWETLYAVDNNGTITSTNGPHKRREWSGTIPSQVDYSLGGHQNYDLIKYEFKITDTAGTVYNRAVNHAINPYPPSTVNGNEQPVPVYAQADVAQSMDMVFIRDDNYANIDDFHNQCRLMIQDGFLFDIRSDNMTKSLWKYFNFFINPLTGIANNFPSSHVTPSNWSNLTFAEGHAIMHTTNIRDHAYGTLFSTEQLNRGTMIHEAGHALFGLADEYGPSGGHYQLSFLTNNWSNRRDARSEAPFRHKAPNDVSKIHRRQWFKICDNMCQMNNSGSTCDKYDLPCRDRMEYTIRSNAGIPYP